ncbi:RAD52 family DNA repair protein [Methylocella sp. CPCC 101449]|uniref:RAD52 family DNA repair protein n=1 Tax=Methylocella sp. CPCC 101449 TaxID=2987531 RepID=UPI00288C6A3A|nr:RAD52 family DNA repair protein [Methylocella sp. CPCC 101449]MDT2019474.1 RAD52 family DNA repair protein [Methylocella sp. CPCC 101449]
MSFTDAQVKALKTAVKAKDIKQRDVDGKTLNYLEGWHVVAEANRIFGFDGWDRETVSSHCVLQKAGDQRFLAVYSAKVRVTVRAGGRTIVREGLGMAEGIASTVGQAHEKASKAAETDATKRALCTFGNSFGLSLYGEKREVPPRGRKAKDVPVEVEASSVPPAPGRTVAYLPVHVPGRIDKSELTLGEPKRIRNKDHLRFVAGHACLICGRAPSQAHHIRFSQPRALGRKVSDEFTVPLCSIHHSELHMAGHEEGWWERHKIDPLSHAAELWTESRGQENLNRSVETESAQIESTSPQMERNNA